MASKNKSKLTIVLAVTLLVFVSLACGKSVEATEEVGNVGVEEFSDASQVNIDERRDCLNGVLPGTTTRKEAIKLLGDPFKTDNANGFETLLYPSNLPGQYHSVVLADKLVVMTSFVLDDEYFLKWSDVLTEYGSPQKTTYSNYLADSMTYIYPYIGQTFVASTEMDSVFIHQCYQPMVLTEYMSTWGASLPLSNPFNK
jgi:hypothetical protein